MNLTVNTIALSLANYLKPLLPDVMFLQNPAQQGAKMPCMFLQQRYSNVEIQTGGYFLRTIGLDLTYLDDYNLPDLQERYQTAAETLDLVMETFPYNDGANEGTTLIRTHDREWRIDLDALHYKFEIQERVSIPKEYVKMQTIQELNEEVKIKNGEN